MKRAIVWLLPGMLWVAPFPAFWWASAPLWAVVVALLASSLVCLNWFRMRLLMWQYIEAHVAVMSLRRDNATERELDKARRRLAKLTVRAQFLRQSSGWKAPIVILTLIYLIVLSLRFYGLTDPLRARWLVLMGIVVVQHITVFAATQVEGRAMIDAVKSIEASRSV